MSGKPWGAQIYVYYVPRGPRSTWSAVAAVQLPHLEVGAVDPRRHLMPTAAQRALAALNGSAANLGDGTMWNFSFGANITPDQVNYNGNHPYKDGAKGISRKKTISVKKLPQK